MTETIRRTDVLVLVAADTTERGQIARQAVEQLSALGSARIFEPVRVSIHQAGRHLYRHSGSLAEVMYAVTEWGHR